MDLQTLLLHTSLTVILNGNKEVEKNEVEETHNRRRPTIKNEDERGLGQRCPANVCVKKPVCV